MICDTDAIAAALAHGPGSDEYAAERDDVFDALVDAGKCWATGQAPDGGRGWRELLEPEVRRYLDHPYPDLRGAAVRTLAFYWALPAYRDVARRMGRADAAVDVRAGALGAWAGYSWGKRDPAAMRELATMLSDTAEPSEVRAAAYRGLLGVSGYLDTIEARRIGKLLDVVDDVDGRVDWALIQHLVQQEPSPT